MSQRRAKLLKRLANNRARAREGRVLVEGTRAVTEALDAGARVDFAVCSPRLDATGVGVALRARLEASGVETVEATDSEMQEVADTEHPQGVLIVCHEPELTLAEALATDAADGEAGWRVLVLDAVQDPGNVGTLVRSAVAFSFDALVTLDGTADPWSAKAVRAAAGTVFRMRTVKCSAEEAVRVLRSRGLPILVASAEGSTAIDRPSGGFALVLGNEGGGVREALRAAADQTVAVAMSGPAESLNVGIAGSILMSDLTKADR